MKGRDVIKALQAAGWEQVAQKGSHVRVKHAKRRGRVTVPHPERNIHLEPSEASKSSRELA